MYCDNCNTMGSIKHKRHNNIVKSYCETCGFVFG